MGVVKRGFNYQLNSILPLRQLSWPCAMGGICEWGSDLPFVLQVSNVRFWPIADSNQAMIEPFIGPSPIRSNSNEPATADLAWWYSSDSSSLASSPKLDRQAR